MQYETRNIIRVMHFAASVIFFMLLATKVGLTNCQLHWEKCSCEKVECSSKVLLNCTDFALDICKCCQVCKRQVGEKCGGPYDIDGICDRGLACVARYSDENAYCRPKDYGFPGKCYDRDTNTLYRSSEQWLVGCTEKICMQEGRIFSRNVTCSKADTAPNEKCKEYCIRKPETRCLENGMEIAITRELLLDLSRDAFTLRDPRCIGEFNKSHLIIRTGLNDCGTRIKKKTGYVTYSNTVSNSEDSDEIIQRRRLKWSFSCTYPIKRKVSVSLMVTDRTEIAVLMRFTSRGGRVMKRTKYAVVYPGSRIYVTVYVKGLPQTYKIRALISNCFLADSPELKRATKIHTLVQHGCPAENGVQILRSFDKGLWFSFSISALKGIISDGLNLHCSAVLCPEKPTFGPCQIRRCTL